MTTNITTEKPTGWREFEMFTFSREKFAKLISEGNPIEVYLMAMTKTRFHVTFQCKLMTISMNIVPKAYVEKPETYGVKMYIDEARKSKPCYIVKRKGFGEAELKAHINALFMDYIAPTLEGLPLPETIEIKIQADHHYRNLIG